MSKKHCPSRDDLSGYVRGTLPPEQSESVTLHLANCVDCEDTIHRLESTVDPLIDQIRQAGAPQPYVDEAACRKAVESVERQAAQAGEAAERSQPRPTAEPVRPIDRAEFIEFVTRAGFISTDELTSQIKQLPPAEATDVQALARALVAHGKLTKYQAAAIYQSKGKSLVYGDYLVLDRIGAGGMGQVFKARHKRMDRIVALKVLAGAAMKNPDAVKRFEREVRAAAKLIHPNIVHAYDAGLQDGVHYLVMEFVDGPDLSSLVKRQGKLSVRQACDYVAQAARGFAFAHGKGIVHRDIKPGNLLIDRDGTVKVLDMGLARFDDLGGGLMTEGELTQSGAVMGTIDYMAPEQALNTSLADAKSDVYSLGCTLYRVLTGEGVFGGQTMVEKILAHREQRVPSLRRARPDVPPALEALTARMLAKSPADRPSMQEIADTLTAIGAGGPVPAGPATAAGMPAGLGMPPGQGMPNPSVPQAVSLAPPAATGFGLPIGAPRTKGVPPRRRSHTGLIAAAGAGALFIAMGVWIYINNKNGERIAAVHVDDGAMVVVTPEATPSATAAPQGSPGGTPTLFAPPGVSTATPVTPPAPTVAVNSPVPPSAGPPSVAPPAGGNLWIDTEYAPGAPPVITLPAVVFDGSTPLTVEAWSYSSVSPELLAAADRNGSKQLERTIFGFGGRLGVRWELHATLPQNDRRFIYYNHPLPTGRNSTNRVSCGTFARNTSQHVALTVAPLGARQYEFTVWAEGKKLRSLSSEYIPDAVQSLLSDGAIDEIRVSKIVRYTADFTPQRRFDPDADTVGLYHCDEGSGDVLRDSGGHGNHGKLVGAKWVPAAVPSVPGGDVPTAVATNSSAADSSLVCDLLASMKPPVAPMAGAVAFVGPAGGGTNTGNGLIVSAPTAWQTEGTTWSCTFDNRNGGGVQFIHPFRDGHIRIDVEREQPSLFPGGAWSAKPDNVYSSSSTFPATPTADYVRFFPIRETAHAIESRLDSSGGYVLSINGVKVLTARFDAAAPQRLNPPFTDPNCPAVLAAGQAAVIINPAYRGHNEARGVRLSTSRSGAPAFAISAATLPAPTSTDPERRAVEWAQPRGAKIRVLPVGQTRKPGDGDMLYNRPPPAEPFTVIEIDFFEVLNGKEFRRQITDADLQYLAPLKALYRLRLPYGQITDAGLGELAKLKTLDMLDLSETRITDAGLARLAPLSNLTRLDLNRTAVTDAGLGHLASMPRLKVLELNGTRVTAAGIGRLKGTNPLLSGIKWDETATPAQVAGVPSTSPAAGFFPTQDGGASPSVATLSGTLARQPVPDAAARQAALSAVKDVFKDDYAAAKTPARKSELATKLFDQSGKAADPIERYVLLDEAVAIGVEGDDLSGARNALDQLVALFQVPKSAKYVAAWKEMLARARQPETVRALLGDMNRVFDDSVKAAEFDDAKAIGDYAATTAQRLRDVAEIKLVRDRNLELAGRQKEYAAAKTALDKLATTPDDPEANLAVGRYRALVEKDWVNALPRLAKGSDPLWKELATKTVAAGSQPAALSAVADAWWDAAQSKPAQKAELLAGARFWYQAALGALAGLQKTRVENRIAEAGQLAVESKLPITFLPLPASAAASSASVAPGEKPFMPVPAFGDPKPAFPAPAAPSVGGGMSSQVAVTLADPAFQQWMKDVAALPVGEQTAAVSKKLTELNPGFDGRTGQAIQDGQVTMLSFDSTNVTNIAPVRALVGLKSLRCNGKGSPLSDLSPLQGMSLTTLVCGGNSVSDLSPLRGMPLTTLSVDADKVVDLSPLRSMPLTVLNVRSTPVVDLSPLLDCKQLESLNIYGVKAPPAMIDALRKALPNCKFE